MFEIREPSRNKSAANLLIAPKAVVAAPFLKWAGGKNQLLKAFQGFYPPIFGRYHEPFIGGGAVFFDLAAKHADMRATISDSNEELINCYLSIKNAPEELISALKAHRNDKQHFYEIRSQDCSRLSPAERAARMIFLNRTCFNGLYRVNKQGGFNVPFGSYKNPKLIDIENILAVHRLLQKTDVMCRPFEAVVSAAVRNDFVYFDPPYVPLSATANFTSYTKKSFGLEDQRALAKVASTLNKKGCKFMLSNSDTPLIRELYSQFRIEVVKANRAINSNGARRGQINELLILNY